MPKATLSFNLPEENNEYKIAMYANEFYMSLTDIENTIRNWQKYGHENETKDSILEDIRGKITDMIWEIE